MHLKLQQVRQMLQNIDQMVTQLKQQEMSNRQLLGQLEQKEAQASQNLSRIQQMCQECSRIVNTIPSGQGMGQTYGQTYQGQSNFQQGYSGLSGISMMSGAGSFQNDGVRLGQQQNIGSIPPTQTPLIDPATMSASTYHGSMQQIGSPIGSQYSHLQSPAMGTQMGSTISGPQMGNAAGQSFSSGVNMEVSSLPTFEPFASRSNMSPSTFQAASKKLGVAGSSFNQNNAGSYSPTLSAQPS